MEISATDAWLTVEVRDDWCGFGQETASGVGLQSMRERTSEVGGELAIRSETGTGTRVVARLPRWLERVAQATAGRGPSRRGG